MDGTLARWARVKYGIAFGMLAGSLAAVPDVVVATGWGYRVPIALPVLTFVGYLLCGALGGGLLGALCGTRAEPFEDPWRIDEDTRVRIRAACRTACAVGLAAVFFERFRLGYEGYLDRETGAIPAAVALLAGVLSVRRSGATTPALSAALAGWQVLCAASFCAFWQPFTSLYQAPTFSRTSLIANAAYCAGWGLVYVAFGLPLRRILQRSTGTRRWEFRLSTTLTVAVGLVLAGGILRYRVESPIDLANVPTDGPQPVSIGGTASAPNVVLIVIDTARADHMSVYGYPVNTTPRLAAFAEEAVRYDMAIAPSSWTLPSHASLFTGLLPTEHRAHNVRCGDGWTIRPLADSYLTMAEVLSAAGYRSGAVVANTACLSREFGVQQGFDYFDDHAKPSLAAAKLRSISPARWLLRTYQRSLEGWRTDWSRNASEINADALTWLDRGGDGPFFLFLNYLDPHEPYHEHADVAANVARLPEASQEMHRYDQEIAFTDAQIGKLFDNLRARGVYDNSLIIVTSDHGEAFGEHGSYGHGHTLYQEEVHVPLMIRYPNARTQSVLSEPISLTEVPAIVYRHLGIGRESNVDGPTSAAAFATQTTGIYSLASDIGGGSERVFAELREVDAPQDGCNVPVVRAMYDCEGAKTIVSSRGIAEYYDLASDPDELFDLSGECFDGLERALASVDTWTEQVEARRRASEQSVVLSDALRDRLRSLGYLK